MNTGLGNFQRKYFCVQHNAQTGPVSLSGTEMFAVASFLEVKRVKRGSDLTSPPSAEVNTEFKFIQVSWYGT
jgi:hypothetical protein